MFIFNLFLLLYVYVYIYIYVYIVCIYMFIFTNIYIFLKYLDFKFKKIPPDFVAFTEETLIVNFILVKCFAKFTYLQCQYGHTLTNQCFLLFLGPVKTFPSFVFNPKTFIKR